MTTTDRRERWAWWAQELLAYVVCECGFRLFNLAGRFSKGWDDELNRDRGAAARAVGRVAGWFYATGCNLTPVAAPAPKPRKEGR